MVRQHLASGNSLKSAADFISKNISTIFEWKKKYPTFSDAIKRGESDYVSSLTRPLVDHMAKGLSFESFAGTIGRSKSYLYDLSKNHPEFQEAKEQGEAKSLLFWEKLSIAGAMGQLTRLKKEVERRDKAGNVTVDREYTTAFFNVTSVIFNMKNRFKDWRDPDDSRVKRNRELDKALKQLDDECQEERQEVGTDDHDDV